MLGWIRNNKKRGLIRQTALLLAVGMLLLAGAGIPARAAPMRHTIRNDLHLHSGHALLIRLDNGEELLNHRADERIAPASLTKIMTAVVALEQLPDLSRRIPLRSGLFEDLSTTAGFQPEEQVRAVDLLYGLLLASGAECAVGLAEYTAGSQDAFVELMNRKALDLGMAQTHFVNVSGQHHPAHYSTPRDLAVLVEYALQNPVFYRIFTAETHTTEPTVFHPEGLLIYSMAFARLGTMDFRGGKILGGKTGYIPESGQSLITLAQKDGISYLLVTSGAYPEDYQEQALHADDALLVYRSLR